MNNPRIDFWKNKRVLVTGHTGFKGAWLSFWLTEMGAKVVGVSLPPSGIKNLYSLLNLEKIMISKYQDIRNFEKINTIIREERPEVVFHMAAQPLVRASYKDPLFTYSTNIMGSVNILEAIRQYEFIRTAIIITTDKVYVNKEWVWPYRENDRLGGHDPYSASKAAAEIVVDSYRDSYLKQRKISVSTARAGNVIGGGDWSEDRLIPDLISSYERSGIVEIRNPSSIRPWQHVLEPLLGYILLAEKTYDQQNLCGAYNIGPDPSAALSVAEVVGLAEIFLNKKISSLQNSYLSNQPVHEAGILKLDCSMSKKMLGIAPKWGVEIAIKKTIDWYLEELNGKDAVNLCRADLSSYIDSGV